MAATVDDFLRTLMRSELLDRETLRTALRDVPKEKRDQPRAVADFLVQKKLLTTFQSNKVLAGTAMGLKIGPYVVEMPIGKGGMGTVYRARDTRNGETVAIKVVSPKLMKEGDRHLTRFKREMRLSQKLVHPNVAATKDVGDFRGVNYLVLEYIPGVTLHRLVTRGGPLEPARAARLFCEVCSALEHAHAQGLIHRDLKPTNIMVTPDDHAKVLDLGLALIEGEAVDDPEVVGGKGYIVGSIDYIAPEQTYDAAAVDPRADLYSLGCTLYFALCGKGPFTVGDQLARIKAHRHEAAEPLCQRAPGVPQGLADFVHRLMEKDPKQRLSTAKAVREGLLRWSEPEAAPRSLTDSAANFTLIDVELAELDDGRDILSEVFQITDAEPNGEPAAPRRDGAKKLFDDDISSDMLMWLSFGAIALLATLALFIVLMRS